MRLKKYLILAGASAAGFFIFVILHNLVSGLVGEEPVFFVLAVLVCPIGFVVGVVGSGIQLFRKGL
jgi:hypothetical protein